MFRSNDRFGFNFRRSLNSDNFSFDTPHEACEKTTMHHCVAVFGMIIQNKINIVSFQKQSLCTGERACTPGGVASRRWGGEEHHETSPFFPTSA